VTNETDAEALASSPLGAIDVTYRREREGDDASHETLTIMIRGRTVATVIVRTEAHGCGDERVLLDVLTYAMGGNGAQEAERP
jgi:hypothetical protein